ncbi:shufflon protein B [Salmonella enterica]|nr:shufflon protein B [Salmonella enterica]
MSSRVRTEINCALAYVPIRYLEIIISVDMDEYKNIYVISKNTQVLGRFKLCINTYRIDGREMAETEVVPIDMPDSNGEMTWQAKTTHSIRPTL